VHLPHQAGHLPRQRQARRYVAVLEMAAQRLLPPSVRLSLLRSRSNMFASTFLLD
jgi:hypothetical protein